MGEILNIVFKNDRPVCIVYILNVYTGHDTVPMEMLILYDGYEHCPYITML